MFADARMPVWGVSALISNVVLLIMSKCAQRWLCGASFLMLVLFVVIYNRWSKPINRLQTEAARAGQPLDTARELQAAWDRALIFRAPLLVAALLAQCLVLLAAGC